ncbi:hypothetical protein ACQ4PT_043857 [Festuca glaucescens]
MAEAVIGSLVGKLQELMVNDARSMAAVDDDIRSLRDKLMWMQAFLRDAEPRRRVQNDEVIGCGCNRPAARSSTPRTPLISTSSGSTSPGKSGVGKTKLVRNMYEEHFKAHAWVSFAPNLSVSNILKLIIQRLEEGNVTYTRENARENIKENLRETKYLLVIDGEVSSTEWKQILSDLPDGKAGSRVVQITQTKSEQSPTPPIVLEDLTRDEATKLFLDTLFMEEKGEKYSTLVLKAVRKEHEEDIYEITGGLPLAVVLLSGLLRTK